MDSERFDGFVRSFGQARTRRQTLRGLAGAGALLALLAAKPVAAGKTGQPGGSQPGNSPPGSGQNGQPGGSQPGPLGGGQSGSPGPSPDCAAQCQERYEGCVEPCDTNPSSAEFCLNRCATQQDACLARCPTG
jgi:hypothetical protein